MNPHYQIRIQAILAQDDDGTKGATVTVAGIKDRLAVANAVYSSANISFVFDEDTDLLRINSTLLNRSYTIFDPPDVDGNKWSKEPRHDQQSHDEARTRLARLFPGKLVIFFRMTTRLKKKDGVWQNSGTNSSGWAGSLVNMSRSGDDNLNTVAHELGHHLQIRHSHRGGIATVADAAAKIKGYVEANGLPISQGLDALDADLVWVTDTPADANDGIFTNSGQDPCGPVAQLPIPVTFSNNTSHVYTLAPERTNVMSYYRDCPGVTPTISPQQARRVRDGLEMGLRHHLISLKPRPDYIIVQGSGKGDGGAISKLDVAMVRAGRVATAVRAGDGKLKVIVWDVEPHGNRIIRRGDESAEAISEAAICSMGLGMVATAVIAAGELMTIVWQIQEDGSVTRKGSGSIHHDPINDVAACRVGISHLATAARRADGKLRVDVWHVTSKGEITHQGSETAGQVNMPGDGAAATTPRLTMNGVGKESFVTYVRDGSHNLKAILWRFDESKITRLDSAGGEDDPVVALACAVPERETAAVAVRGFDGDLKLIAYNFPDDGERVRQRATRLAGAISDVAICPMGTELCVTGVRGAGNRLKLILWLVSKDGHHIIRRDDVTGEDITRLAMCYAGADQFVTAARDTVGNLKITAWRLQTPALEKLGVSGLNNLLMGAAEPTDSPFSALDDVNPDLETRCDSEPNGSVG